MCGLFVSVDHRFHERPFLGEGKIISHIELLWKILSIGVYLNLFLNAAILNCSAYEVREERNPVC